MNFKEIKQVVELMKRSDISEFDIEEEGLKLRIKRGGSNEQSVTQIPMQAVHTMPPFPMQHAPAAPAAAAPAPEAAAPAEDVGVEVIKSPMVGTFYSAASPESAPFVTEGATIKPDTVVCIVEAMKVMNEIQAEMTGKIVGILVENGESIEYGQPLFKVKKA